MDANLVSPIIIDPPSPVDPWYEPAICEPHTTNGLFLPIFRATEGDWHRGLRIPLYFIGLVWLFVGMCPVVHLLGSRVIDLIGGPSVGSGFDLCERAPVDPF